MLLEQYLTNLQLYLAIASDDKNGFNIDIEVSCKKYDGLKVEENETVAVDCVRWGPTRPSSGISHPLRGGMPHLDMRQDT